MPATSSCGQQRHESIATSTVDLNGRPLKNSGSAITTSNRSRPDQVKLSFDQLIDSINFSNVDRAAVQERELSLMALNLYSLPSNHSWTDTNQRQPARNNLFYSSPSTKELGNVKRSSGSAHACLPSQQQSQQQQPIKDVNTDKNTNGRTPQVPTSSTRAHSQDTAQTRSRFFDIESAASLLNANNPTSPRFAAISSGIKHKSNSSKSQTNEHLGKLDRNQATVSSQQPSTTAPTELGLLEMVESSSSPSNEVANNMRMLVCGLGWPTGLLIDGNTAGSSTDASRYPQVGVFLVCF